MKIKSIYIGGWFQRTMLQLSEIYDFLRDGTSQLGFDQNKLTDLHDKLRIDSIEYGVANEEFVAFSTEDQIRVKLFEDGLIVISSDKVSEDTMLNDVEHLHTYYNECLSPTINYLFSTGAPVFKELSRVENIYPYFIVCDNASQKELSDLLAQTERQKYFEFDGKNYDVVRGDKYYFINDKKAPLETIERYIEEQIFIREFKGQLHRYLNLHRSIWSKIDAIKKQALTSEVEILEDITKLERYEKTALLIKGRLEQMATYVKIREAGVRDDAEIIEFLAISGYRYSALFGTLEYMQSLWRTTRDYAKTAQRLLARASQERIIHGLRDIAILLGVLVATSILGLLFGTVLNFTVDTFIYAAILIIVAVLGVYIYKNYTFRKQYLMSLEEEKERHEN